MSKLNYPVRGQKACRPIGLLVSYSIASVDLSAYLRNLFLEVSNLLQFYRFLTVLLLHVLFDIVFQSLSVSMLQFKAASYASPSVILNDA